MLDANCFSWSELETKCREWLASNSFHHVITLNSEIALQAEKNTALREGIQKAEIKIADSSGIVLAHWWRTGEWGQRVTGVDAVSMLARLCVEKNLTIQLEGGTPEQNTGAAKMLQEEFPGLVISDTSPAVLLVAYGSPKQSLWIEEQRTQLPTVRIAMGVGGAFAMISGLLPRAPLALQRAGLEWLWRLWLEPRRFPRIFRAVIAFPLRTLLTTRPNIFRVI